MPIGIVHLFEMIYIKKDDTDIFKSKPLFALTFFVVGDDLKINVQFFFKKSAGLEPSKWIMDQVLLQVMDQFFKFFYALIFIYHNCFIKARIGMEVKLIFFNALASPSG